MDTSSVGLHHSRVGIDIDNQSRQSIAFAMDEAVSIVVIANQAKSLTQLIG